MGVGLGWVMGVGLWGEEPPGESGARPLRAARPPRALAPQFAPGLFRGEELGFRSITSHDTRVPKAIGKTNACPCTTIRT